MRFLDALRAMAGYDLVLMFWPEHATQISVWVESISMGDAARLVMGKATSADDASVVGALDHFPSGVDHVFVMWKTNKGHLFVSERLHDGRVMVEDLHRGSMFPFAHGKAMPTESLHRASGGASGHGVGPAAAGSQAGQAAMATTPEEAAKLISGGKAQIFSHEHLTGGPSVAQILELAKAKSAAGYDLLQANCQHYAQDLWKFAEGHRLGMPNQDFLNLFQIFGSPAHGAKVLEPGVLGNASYSLRAAGAGRFILDAALVKMPVVPAKDEDFEAEGEEQIPQPSVPSGVPSVQPSVQPVVPEREQTWV